MSIVNSSKDTTKLVDANQLLDNIFEKESRPSVRWVRKMQAERRIPYVKCGRLVRFDPEAVRRTLLENWTIRAKNNLK